MISSDFSSVLVHEANVTVSYFTSISFLTSFFFWHFFDNEV
jgi:hypothetical protein